MITPIGRFLNAFPDWVIPFAAATASLLGLFYGGRFVWRQAGRRRTWTPWRIARIGIAGFMAAVACGWLFLNVVRPTYQAFRADGWHTAQGRVKRCRLIPHDPGGDLGGTTYSVDFLYGFVLDGQGYEGDRYDASVHFKADHDTKAAFAAAYPPGTPVTIRYNPVDGDDSFLTTRLPSDLFDGAWLPLLGLAIAIGLAAVTCFESDTTGGGSIH